MNCWESRPLLAARPLDGLDDDELSALDAHLADCTSCQGRRAALDDAFDLLTDPVFTPDEPQLPEGAWAKITASIEAEPYGEDVPAETADLPIALSCTFCHDGLVKADSTYCASCLAPHHAECFAAHGRCSAPGCEETHTVRPRLEVHLGNGTGRKRPRLRTILGLGLGLAALAAVAALTIEQQDLVQSRNQDAEMLEQYLALKKADEAQPKTTGPAYLGVRLKNADGGVEVTQVFPAGPAAVAGLSKGDILRTLDRRAIEDVDSLKKHLSTLPPHRVKIEATTENGEADFLVALSSGGPPAEFLSGSPSGATYAPVKVLGWDRGHELLLSSHARQTLVLGDYETYGAPDGDVYGRLTLTEQVAGSKETYHTFAAHMPAAETLRSSPWPGLTLWLKLKDPSIVLPRDIAEGSMGFNADGSAVLLTPKQPPVYLGVRLETREPDDKGVRGLLVKAILPDAPAKTAGLRVGDVLVAAEKSRRLGERQLNTFEELRSVLAAYRQGDVLMIRTLRKGESDAVAIAFPVEASVEGNLSVETGGTFGALVLPKMLGVQLQSWTDDAFVFTTSDTRRLIGGEFSVSLRGGASFANVRVSAKSNGRWLATPLNGGGADLDLPPGTHLTLTGTYKSERILKHAATLYVEGPPSWSYRTLHPILTKQEDGAQVFLQSADRDFRQPSTKGLPPLSSVPQDLSTYRRIILGDVGPESIDAGDLWAFVRGGGKLILRPGVQGLGQYGTGIAALAPVICDVAPRERTVESFTLPASGHHIFDEVAVNSMPALQRTSLATPREGAQVLLGDENGLPLVATWTVGRGAVLYVGASDLYAWRRVMGAKAYAGLWSRLVNGGAGNWQRDTSKALLVLEDDTPLGDAIDLLIQLSGQHIVLSGQTTQSVSGTLEGPWRDVLDVMAGRVSCETWAAGSTVYVWPSGSPITIQFQDTDLRTVLAYLGRRSKKRALFAGQGERVTVDWRNKTLDECLADLGKQLVQLEFSVQDGRIRATYIEDD